MVNSRTKSTFILVAVAMAVFTVIAVLVAKSSSRLLVEEATETVRSVVKNTTGRIDRMMASVQTAVEAQCWVIRENLDKPDYMHRVTDAIALNHADIYGSCIAFIPDFYKSKGRYFAIYTYVSTNGVSQYSQIGSDAYHYYEWEWYTSAKRAGKPVWSEPYFDEYGGKMLMCTYSVPIYDSKTNFCAILTADLTLKRLTDQVAAICPFPNSYAVLRSKGGETLVPPPAGKDGGADDGNSITIREVAENGWTVEITCPIDEILSGSREMVKWIVCLSALGLVMLFALARFFARRLEHEAELRERLAHERMTSEFNTARNIQSSLVPRAPLDNVSARLRPAFEIGGDIYDYRRVSNRLYFIVGDASGKGVPAALFSFMAGTVFRMACTLGLNPGEIAGRINAALCYNNDMSMFVTAFIGALDLTTGVLEFACAGHNPPVIIRPDGSAEFLKVEYDLPTGALADTFYTLQSTRLEPGTKIIVYSDGVTEAEGVDGSQYGEERLLEFARANSDKNVLNLVSALLDSVDQFSKGTVQSDDITIMAVRC